MQQFPVRKDTRLSAYEYLGQRAYFITLCCFHRRKIFSTQSNITPILNLLRSECAIHSFGIHAYCFMPDHLHFLAEGLGAASNFLRFINSFKYATSKSFAQQNGNPLWQKSFYERILRSSESLESAALYIWLNPVRKGLAAKIGEYLYAGSLTGKNINQQIDVLPQLT
jgi:putative transposase